MRFLRAPFALALLLAFTGCGYVHFGRLPATQAGDGVLNTAYSDLATEHKILKQELVLSRKEGDALRTALDNRGTAASPELTARLNETARELAALRASYAKLQADRTAAAAAPAPADTAVKARDLEEKLAASLRSYTQLQEENARLRTEVDRTRTENTALALQVKTAAAQNDQAQLALSQLNTELLAQKEARARAEQQSAASSAQLAAVVAQGAASGATLADARSTTATGAITLAPPPPQSANQAFPGPAGSTAELRTNPARLKPEQAAAPAPATPAPASPRFHVVQPNDTLEKIAQKYYGDPARWRTIYFANNAMLSGGRPLKPGMELEIPAD